MFDNSLYINPLLNEQLLALDGLKYPSGYNTPRMTDLWVKHRHPVATTMSQNVTSAVEAVARGGSRHQH